MERSHRKIEGIAVPVQSVEGFRPIREKSGVQRIIGTCDRKPADLLFRILVAAVLGGVLGLERDIHGRGAGLRTHLLVSAGAALFMIDQELSQRTLTPAPPAGA